MQWTVTGAAGFIGSHLLEALLHSNQRVVGLDNFATGRQQNLTDVQKRVGSAAWANFTFLKGDIADLECCRHAVSGSRFVLHQAALGSVPASIADPVKWNRANIDGFLNMLVAARDEKISRFVYASSSSVFGDEPNLPKREEKIGRPLSPYALTKLANELYAEVFARNYGFESIGLRYFNVFGPRQDPNGPYAAVIPQWVSSLLRRSPIYINGDGETSRDFCYVDNVVQANLLAATTERGEAINQVYNVAIGERTTLNELFRLLQTKLSRDNPQLGEAKPTYREFRAGDVRHSEADISKAKSLLGYQPTHRIADGLDIALDWYVKNLS